MVAPKLFEHYTTNQRRILAVNTVHDVLSKRWKDCPFAACSVNLGPRTICQRHKDLKNLAAGVCSITALGDFDWKKGGHLVLHELKLILELRPGDTIFLPSALIAHENIPIGWQECRNSIVLYSAGGLFRWADAGGQTLKEWSRADRDAFIAHSQRGEARWEEGLNRFPTLEDILAAGKEDEV